MSPSSGTRRATLADLPAITEIYNQGIEDGVATLEYPTKSEAEMRDWFAAHDDRYAVLVASENDSTIGWASLNRYSHRCAYDGVADLSVYVRRDRRGQGVGMALLQSLERAARSAGFHKLVLFALTDNAAGKRLYERCGFREVGVFCEQGKLRGQFVDVLIMEKVLKTG